MITVAVSGMNRDKIAKAVKDAGGPDVQVLVTSDFEAALAVHDGNANYYVGACLSGAGGALAIATALLGQQSVARLSGLGKVADPALIEREVADGKKAFGLASAHVDTVIPLLVHAMLQRPPAA